MRILNIPSSWTKDKLGNVCDMTSGGTPSRKRKDYFNGNIPWVKSGELTDGLVKDIEEFITDEAVKNSSAKIFPAGTLLVALYGATVGKLGILTCDAASNQAVCALFPQNGLDTKYLFWYLRCVRNDLVSQAIGGAQPNINQGILRNLVVPIAPKIEQKRIVSEIEKRFSRLNEATAALKRIKANLKRYKASVLKAAVEGKLTEEWRKQHPDIEPASEFLKRIKEKRKLWHDKADKKTKQERTKKPKKNYDFSIIREKSKIPSWAEANLENLIYIAGRIGWRGLKAEEYTENGPLFFSVHSLNYGEKVDFRDALHISMDRYNESPEIQLQENDILLAKDGSGIGKIGIINNLDQLATVNSSLLVIRSLEAFIPKFLFYFLSGPQLQSIVKQRITGSATPHLFQRDIKKFTLSIPPLEEQKEIVKELEQHLTIIEKLELSINISEKRSELLRQSILKKAFSGKLIPQDSNEETTIKLLKKIKAPKEKLISPDKFYRQNLI